MPVLAVLLALGLLLGNAGHFIQSIGTNNHTMSRQNTSEENAFEGTITNQKISIGTFDGVGAYDRNCVDAGNGLTKCDAGIKTEEYGVLNFSYIHNMMTDPCIKPGDTVKVKILDNTGSVTVQRGL